jgi:hypothetical protein
LSDNNNTTKKYTITLNLKEMYDLHDAISILLATPILKQEKIEDLQKLRQKLNQTLFDFLQ